MTARGTPGTPEPDRYGQGTGRALLVDIEGPHASPRVVEKEVGTYRWHDDSIEVTDTSQLDDFVTQLGKFAAPLSRLILQLNLSGTADLLCRQFIREWEERLRASVFHLDYNDARMHIRPSDADLERIDFDGVLRRTAEQLRQRMQDPGSADADRQTAEDALVLLFELSDAN